MTETRIERTPLAGLLALMSGPSGAGAPSSTQGWAFPYWNQYIVDAILAALHDAPRTGVALLTAPDSAPTVAVSASDGLLPAGQTLEIVQTWVDEYGRETTAGPVGSVSTGLAIANPDTAPVLGTPSAAATGFDGGLLEVWYTWYDDTAGETLQSPVASVNLPYHAGGLKSQVLVTLPATPASVGAAGAWVYARHRSSANVPRAAVVSPDTATAVSLDGTWIDCFAGLPLANTTGAKKAIDITGIAAPAGAAYTRFYVRQGGETWSAADRRLKLGAADQYDPATVTYPLVFTGAVAELTAGYPPEVSQVQAIRPFDLASEAIGLLPAANLPAEAVLEEELARSIGDGILSGFAVSATDPASMDVSVGAGEAILAAGRYTSGSPTMLAIPTADVSNPRIDLVCISSELVLQGPTQNVALKGVAAASPSAPEVPAGYLALAEILVDAGATSIVAGKITDRREVLRNLRTVDLDFLAHEADAILHGSKPYSIPQITETCAGSATKDFAFVLGPALVTRVKLVCASAGGVNYDLELFEDAARTITAYKASGITDGTWIDGVPWEWFAAGGTCYGRITNMDAGEITSLLIDLFFRR